MHEHRSCTNVLCSLCLLPVAGSDAGSASGPGAVAASWDLGDDCPLPNDPMGFAPPKFLMWALGLYMLATQLVFWLGYVVMGNAIGFSHLPPQDRVPGARSPSMIGSGGISSPHLAAMAHQNAQASAAASAQQNGEARHGEGTRRV